MEDNLTKFHEGQEVEVLAWHKAYITYIFSGENPQYKVQFRDGARGVFDADHVRITPQQRAQEYYDNPPAKPL